MATGGGSQPQAPDPAKTIPLQTQANKDTMTFALDQGRVNQYTPWGSQIWDKSPVFDEAGFNAANDKWQQGTGPEPTRENFTNNNWSFHQNLSPDQQRLFDANTQSQLQRSGLLEALTKRVGESTQDPFRPDLPEFGQAPGDPQEYGSNAADAMYRQQTRYLDPQIQQQQSAQEARLAEQGFVPGTPAYETAMSNFRDNNARTYADARDRSIGQGAAVGNQWYSQALQGGQFQNQTRQQALMEALQMRGQPLQELLSLQGGTQAIPPNLPAQYSVPGMSAPDVMGATGQQYQGQLGAYNASTAGANQTNNALLSALSSYAMYAALSSDVRLKKNLIKIGDHPVGVPRYSWDWKDGSGSDRGVLAQDLQKVRPDAVVEGPDGMLMVQYGKIGGR
jgi:hypothetical protein